MTTLFRLRANLRAAKRGAEPLHHARRRSDRAEQSYGRSWRAIVSPLRPCGWWPCQLVEELMIDSLFRVVAFVFLFAVAGQAGCGSSPISGGCPGPGCTCTATTCSCAAGASCMWQGSSLTGCDANGGSCSFRCTDASTCQGSCNGSCSAACQGGSTCTLTTGKSGSIDCDRASCTLTVGTSGSVSCTSGATCHVTCTGPSCSVSCSGGSTCDLVCPGTTTPRSIPNGGQC